MEVRPLVDADIPEALRLSTQAGWNQLDADWRRLIALWPGHCFAVADGPRLIATGTLAVYDAPRIGWIGMILVDESRRGQGLGGAMMDHLIAVADAQGIEHLGLDATEQGRPVYLKRGFADQFEIVRAVGDRSAVAAGAPAARRVHDDDWPAIAALDRKAVGVDRSALLRHMAAEPGATMRVIRRGGRISGCGLARRGRTAAHIGPITADGGEDAADLFDALLADVWADGARRVQVDCSPQTALAEHVRGRGLAAVRRLRRMSRPASEAPLLHGVHVHAAAAFELG